MLLNKPIPLSYILGMIKIDMIYVLIVGLLSHYLLEDFHAGIPEIPVSIPAFVGTSISVLLSFKMAQSYDRWWEARKIWGKIVNDSRFFVLACQSLIKSGNEQAIEEMAFRQIAWCHSLTNSLRGQPPIGPIGDLMSAQEKESLTAHQNKPLAILQLNIKQLKQLRESEQIDAFSQIHLLAIVGSLTDSMGMAERIRNTVFPTTYRIFLHLLIYFFVVILGVALSDVPVYFEAPLLMCISGGFFLLERSATSLEDPFTNQPTDTPMQTISRSIEINIKQLLQKKEVLAPISAKDFYSM